MGNVLTDSIGFPVRDYFRNILTLAFQDRDQEEKFRKHYFDINLQSGRIWHILAVFFFVMVAAWDVIFLSSSRISAWIWVSSFVTVMFSAGLLTSFFVLEKYARFWQKIFAFYVIMTGVGFTVVTVLGRPDYPVYNYMGIIFCLIFNYTLIRLDFVHAAVSGNFIVTVYFVATGLIVRPPTVILFTGFFYVMGINLLGMIVCYSMERMSRRSFILNRMLKQVERETQKMNEKLELTVRKRTRDLEGANRELLVSLNREKELTVRLAEEERQLQKSLQALEQAESIARLGYFEKNWVSGEIYLSRGLRKFSGMEADLPEHPDREFYNMIHKDDREEVKRRLDESRGAGRVFDMNFRLVQKTGRVLQLHGEVVHAYGEDGTCHFSRGIFQDITRRIEAEDALQDAREQLLQSQKMESIGRLAGGVAHDYNNISSIVIGYSEMALDKLALHDPLRPNIEEIHRAALRAAKVTRQLLAFARKQTVEPIVVDLNDVVESLLSMLQRLIGENVKLVWKPGIDLWPLKIDPTQIDQILANLCVNSRDAIEGTGTIIIETAKVTVGESSLGNFPDGHPGDYLVLTVTDDGKGIEPEVLDMVFEPFFTTKEAGKGTGLGLSTVYGTAKQNGGFVKALSETGKGTTIQVYLPRTNDLFRGEPFEPPTDVADGKSGETILVVEDDEAIRRLGKIMLEMLGYSVVTAAGPEEALAIARKNPGVFDLLLTDVIMPEMDGRELSNRLRSIMPGLKILFMSGYTENVIVHHGVVDPGVAFIAKPFSQKDIAAKVRQVLDSA